MIRIIPASRESIIIVYIRKTHLRLRFDLRISDIRQCIIFCHEFSMKWLYMIIDIHNLFCLYKLELE